MTTVTHTTTDQRALRNLKWIAIAAVAATAVAAAAGAILVIAQPAAGSTFEGALGLTAAVSGLSVGALAIAGVIYAQAKNLWRYVPTSIRSIIWTLIVIALVVTVLDQFTRLLDL